MLAVAGLPASPASAAPANDNLANAVLVTSLPYRNTRSTLGATRQVGEVTPACHTPQATVWYEVKLATATTVAITTTGSTYDTALAVWHGPTRVFSSLDATDCVDDLGTHLLSALAFEAAANVRYFIQVASGSPIGQTGTLKIRITTGQQILVPETGSDAAASVAARIVIATDVTGTEIIGRERLQGCVSGICFPFVEAGHEADAAAPPGRACVTAVMFVQQCYGTPPG